MRMPVPHSSAVSFSRRIPKARKARVRSVNMAKLMSGILILVKMPVITVTASSRLFARNSIHARQTRTNVTAQCPSRCTPAYFFLPMPIAFSMQSRSPCKVPQQRNVQFAPCQIPLTMNVTMRLKYWRLFFTRLPPKGMYT